MRFIDADKLWNNRPQLSKGKSIDYGAGFSECMWGFSERIKEQISHPTADVVEVVRCKDCMYFTGKDYDGCCIKNGLATRYANDFCSYGERREE